MRGLAIKLVGSVRVKNWIFILIYKNLKKLQVFAFFIIMVVFSPGQPVTSLFQQWFVETS